MNRCSKHQQAKHSQRIFTAKRASADVGWVYSKLAKQLHIINCKNIDYNDLSAFVAVVRES